jgi:parallel beta-helix repeat protein
LPTSIRSRARDSTTSSIKVVARLADVDCMTATLKSAFFLFLAVGAYATTYYVDPNSGNDFASGFSATPTLRTLSAVSQKLYYPGDKILLKAGSTFSGELNITTSDATGDSVLVSYYGAGAAPLVSSVNLSNATNVTVSGLTLSDSSTLIKVSGGSGNTVTKCTLSNAGLYGAYVTNSPNFTFSYNTYTTTGTFAQSGGKAIIVQGSVTGVSVFNNTIVFNDASKRVPGIYIVDVNGVRIHDNNISGGSQGIGIKGIHRSVTDAQVYRNSIYRTDNRAADGESIEYTGINGYTVSGKIFRNFVQGWQYTKNAIAAFHGTNVATYGNVIIGPLANTAIHYSSSSYGGSAYNNTIYNVPIAFSASSGSGLTIRNNIVSHAHTVVSTDNRTTTTEGYNDFYASGGVGAGHFGNSITSDPSFVNSTPSSPLDVKLASGSPNIRSGIALNATYRYANAPRCTAWACPAWDQTVNGWNRGAFGF